jgi:hypothetical protein
MDHSSHPVQHFPAPRPQLVLRPERQHPATFFKRCGLTLLAFGSPALVVPLLQVIEQPGRKHITPRPGPKRRRRRGCTGASAGRRWHREFLAGADRPDAGCAPIPID